MSDPNVMSEEALETIRARLPNLTESAYDGGIAVGFAITLLTEVDRLRAHNEELIAASRDAHTNATVAPTDDTRLLDDAQRFLCEAGKYLPNTELGFTVQTVDQGDVRVTILGNDDMCVWEDLRGALRAALELQR